VTPNTVVPIVKLAMECCSVHMFSESAILKNKRESCKRMGKTDNGMKMPSFESVQLLLPLHAALFKRILSEA